MSSNLSLTPPERACDTLRSIVVGNGLRPDQVVLEGQQTATYDFAGTVRIKLSPRIAHRQIPGRDTKTQIVADERALHIAVQQHMSHLIQDPRSRDMIMGILLKRPDKGFGIDGRKIAFKTLSQSFAMHEGCRNCAARGHVTCHICHGHRQVQCHGCRGARTERCNGCGGNGYTQGPAGNSTCGMCGGSGHMACRICGGSGVLGCKNCSSSGHIKCLSCSGTGWMTTLITAEIDAEYRFNPHMGNLPPRAQQILTNLGGKAAEIGAADIAIDQVIGPENDVHMPKDEMVVVYRGKMPYGPVRFMLGKRPVDALMYGYNGMLADCPPFLEKIGARPIAALLSAAEHRKTAGADLAQAAQARFIRLALSASMMSARPRAIELYKVKFPYGLSEIMVRDLLVLAERGARNASFIYRVYAAAAAILISAGVLAAYGPGQGFMYLHNLTGASLWVHMAVDILVLAALCALTLFIPRIAGWIALRRGLGAIMKNDAGGLMPRAGYLEWGIALMVPVIFGLFIALGAPAPDWVRFLGIG